MTKEKNSKDKTAEQPRALFLRREEGKFSKSLYTRRDLLYNSFQRSVYAYRIRKLDIHL